MMSSIHSQSSDSHLADQEVHLNLHQKDHDQLQQPQFYNEKTPAIQEEEEEVEEDGEQQSEHGREGMGNGFMPENRGALNLTNKNNSKGLHLQKTKSHHSSGNSSSSSNSNSNSNGNSNRSTITFEKQKVVPPRARAQSAQSVLSNLSLRSLLLQNNLPQQQPQQPPAGNENNSTTNYGNLNQQIQSPAMSSSMRRKAPTNVMFRRNSSENEIGLQLPFTDDKRLDLDAKQVVRRNLSRNSLLRRQHSSNIVETVEIEDEDSNEEQDTVNYQIKMHNHNNTADDNEDDEASQKKLTENALQKLSLMKSRGLQKSQSDTSSDSSERIENMNEAADNETFESIASQGGSMTHLQFGNKRVILDSSSFLNSNNGNGIRPIQQQMQQQIFRPSQKPSLAVIQQPCETTGKSKVSSKKNCKQISNPKKPLYTPAVLRDTAETNITIDDLIRPDSPQHTLLNNLPANSSARSTYNPSSQASIYSTTSSLLETCKKKISLYLFPTSNRSNPEIPYNYHLESPRPPRQDHWLPDSKRASCHYCHKLFTFLERKHHCRHCGDIFCNQHLSHWLYLNANAEFIIGGGGMGTLSKICDGCLEDYENLIKNPSWKNQKNSNPKNSNQTDYDSDPDSNRMHRCNTNNNNDNSNSQQSPNAITVDTSDKDVDTKKGNGDIIGSVVGSVPADWNWSSF